MPLKDMLESEFMEKYGVLLGIIVTFFASYLVILASLWQLTILAAVVGGIFTKKTRIGALIGSAGIGLSWLVYVLMKVMTSQIVELFNQVGIIIVGSDGFGPVFIGIVILLGFVFGLLGGYLGSSIRVLFENLRAERGTPSERPAEIPANP